MRRKALDSSPISVIEYIKLDCWTLVRTEETTKKTIPRLLGRKKERKKIKEKTIT